jgi:glycosyltransferase involved in cell wall biosynthesis
MKVLWVLRGLGLGGAERLLLEIRPYTTVDFVPLTITDDPDDLADRFAAAGRRSLGASSPFDPRWPRRLREAVREIGPDLVHLHFALPAAAARFALRRTGLPTVYTQHAQWEFYGRAARWASQLSLPRYDAVVAVSDAVRTSIARHARPMTTPVRVLPNGIDIDGLRREVAAGVADPGLLPVGARYGTVGHLTPAKGIDVLLRAAAEVSASSPPSTCVVVGKGPDRSRLVDLSREVGSDCVLFLGQRMDARSVIAGLDVFVLPSRLDAMPLVLLEAMALGRPIVAAAVGGVPEIITDEVTGLLVPPDDPSALAAAIQRLLADAPLARRLGEAARADVETRFDARILATRLEALYEEVLARCASRAS